MHGGGRGRTPPGAGGSEGPRCGSGRPAAPGVVGGAESAAASAPNPSGSPSALSGGRTPAAPTPRQERGVKGEPLHPGVPNVAPSSPRRGWGAGDPPRPGPWSTSSGSCPSRWRSSASPTLPPPAPARRLPRTFACGRPHRAHLLDVARGEPGLHALSDLTGLFSTMSSWNAPYTCSELRAFTQF